MSNRKFNKMFKANVFQLRWLKVQSIFGLSKNTLLFKCDELLELALTSVRAEGAQEHKIATK